MPENKTYALFADRPSKYAKGEIRYSISTVNNEYVVSDGWVSRLTDKEQFLMFNSSGVGMGRFGENEVSDWRLLEQPAVLPDGTTPNTGEPVIKPVTLTQSDLAGIIQAVRNESISDILGSVNQNSPKAIKRRTLDAVFAAVNKAINAK